MRPPVQYRLEILGDLTDADVDGFLDSGFVERAGFDLHADGTWHQTELESDACDPAPADGL